MAASLLKASRGALTNPGEGRRLMTGQQAGRGTIARLIGARIGAMATLLLCAAALAVLPAGAATSDPIKIAIFDFELEDYSAGAAFTAGSPADAEHLARVTDEVRQLFAESGRYDLVDVAAADAAAAKDHTLSQCNGCDAPIALELGAEQSFVGVVRRITRTEFVVRFEIRDTRTGDIVAAENSGLNMGADYSWNRGATRLVKNRLLEAQAQQ
jgi:hypothetical protein